MNITPIPVDQKLQDSLYKTYQTNDKRDLTALHVLKGGQILIKTSKDFCLEITKAELLESSGAIQALVKTYGVTVKQLLSDVALSSMKSEIFEPQEIFKKYTGQSADFGNHEITFLVLKDGRLKLQVPVKIPTIGFETKEITKSDLKDPFPLLEKLIDSAGTSTKELLSDLERAANIKSANTAYETLDMESQIALTSKYIRDSNGNWYTHYFGNPNKEPNLDEYIDKGDLEGYVETFNKIPTDNSEALFDKYQAMHFEKNIWEKREDDKLNEYLIDAGLMIKSSYVQE